MGDDGKVAACMVFYDFGNRLKNTGLRVGCCLPTLMADFGIGEKGVCGGFELRGWQETGGASVVLTKAWLDLNS